MKSKDAQHLIITCKRRQLMKILLITAIILFSFVQCIYSNELINFVAGPKVNLYSESSEASKIISQLEYGQIIDSYETILIRDGLIDQWIKIEINNMEGFILYKYLGEVTKIEEIPPLYLTLKLINGDTVKLQNEPYANDSYRIYELLSYNKDIGFYVVKQYLYEGYYTFLVSDIDGKKYQILDEPIISPDKKQLLVLSSDLYAQYNDSGVEIYSIENNVPVIKYKKMGNNESGPTWGAKNGKWISNSEIEFTKETLSDEGKEEESQVKLKKINGKWAE
ncbi:MAG: hypothetical protein JW927_13350 [Deltaproteobacteria bacterium]|nr:hypothetical protein [Deltaproteobacteria bacterium]